MSTLPTSKVIAVIGREDAGSFGGARCPHCGAEGRYTIRFLCDDGVERGAMAGCFKLFKKATGPVARLTLIAYEKQAALLPGGRLATWWTEIIESTAKLSVGQVTREEHTRIVMAAEARRRAWLNKNGYGRWAGAR